MLYLKEIDVSIGSIRILRGVSFALEEKRTTVLVGRNGAGKTTTLRAIMGLLPLGGGTVHLDALNLGEISPHRRAHEGIGYAPEDRRLVADFTVEENIVLPALALCLDHAERARRLEEIYALLPQLKTMRTRPGGSVSGGQGKMVALGRALMVARKALLLDEPFQGLAPALALDYARTLGALRRHRPELSLLITESSPKLLDGIADCTLQIERGEIVSKSM